MKNKTAQKCNINTLTHIINTAIHNKACVKSSCWYCITQISGFIRLVSSHSHDSGVT